MKLRNLFMPFDTFERHHAVQHFLGIGFTGKLLDAGGTRGILNNFLPEAKIITLNINSDCDIQYSGATFPVLQKSIDAVISLDTLEHIQNSHRKEFIEECIRCAKSAIIISTPYGSDAHVEYEKYLDSFYNKIFGFHHKWLHEHVVNGLPSPEEIIKYLQLIERNRFDAAVYFCGNFLQQCRFFEQSLNLKKFVFRKGLIPNIYLTIMSMALWHPKISFSKEPQERSNRVYIVAKAHNN